MNAFLSYTTVFHNIVYSEALYLVGHRLIYYFPKLYSRSIQCLLVQTPFQPIEKITIIILLVFIAFGVLLFLALFYFIKYRRLRTKAALYEIEIAINKKRENDELSYLELEQKASIAQMNPHFIFNALNTINSLYTNGNLEKANVFMSKFSNLLRMILIHSDRQGVTISAEIKLLTLYFECNNINSIHPFSYKIIPDTTIDCENIIIPPMLIQPFVENSIIHGISSLKEKGRVEVRFTLIQPDLIECIILDNGVGLKRASKTFSQHESKSINITKKRISGLHHDKSIAHPIEIKELLEGNKSRGTKVRFVIPIKTNY